MSKTTSGRPPGLFVSSLSASAFFLRPAPSLLPPRPPVLLDFVGNPTPPFFYPFEIAFFAREGSPPVYICTSVENQTPPPVIFMLIMRMSCFLFAHIMLQLTLIGGA
nr:MAG TPA: hypothetical protein [Caudoviricetes sp.]